MAKYEVMYNHAIRLITVQEENNTTLASSIHIDTVELPDAVAPDSWVAYNKIRSLMLRRSEVDPTQIGNYYPNDLSDMSRMMIVCTAVVPVTGVTATPELTLGTNRIRSVSYDVVPANATTKTATFTSSATGVAKVNAVGAVLGIATGTSNITTTVGSQTATTAVTVVAGETLTAITVTLDEDTIADDGETQAYAVGTVNTTPVSTIDLTDFVVWASSDTDKATIGSRGVISGVAAGPSNITATVGGVTSDVKVITVS